MIDGLKVHNRLNNYGWDQLAQLEVGRVLQFSGIGCIELVAKDVEYDEDKDDGPTLVFKVGSSFEHKYFKKFGSMDSYDVTTWEGNFYEVTPVVKTVEEYKIVE
jgi:hypothetical protein